MIVDAVFENLLEFKLSTHGKHKPKSSKWRIVGGISFDAARCARQWSFLYRNPRPTGPAMAHPAAFCDRSGFRRPGPEARVPAAADLSRESLSRCCKRIFAAAVRFWIACFLLWQACSSSYGRAPGVRDGPRFQPG